MCQRIVVLAARGRTRYISRCEHGTVHLIWDGVGFQLSAPAFVRLTTQIQQVQRAAAAAVIAQPDGYCRLHVNRAVVMLPADEFLSLAAMVGEAQLDKPQSPNAEPLPASPLRLDWPQQQPSSLN